MPDNIKCIILINDFSRNFFELPKAWFRSKWPNLYFLLFFFAGGGFLLLSYGCILHGT